MSQAPMLVTGYAMLHALGANRSEILEALQAGRSGLVPADPSMPVSTFVGAVRTPLDALPSELAAWDTRVARMAAQLLGQLDTELQRARERWGADRIGIVLGTSTAGAESTEVAYRSYVESGAFPAEYDFRKQHTYGAILHVIAELAGARGPAWTISTACTSSAKTLATARRLLHAGVIDAAIVGGIDTLCSMTLAGFHALAALDAKPCRPFSSERLGISIGEGGALALVEREGDARVLVEGVGETSDAYHISHPHPEGHGAAAAMAAALEQAGCTPGDIDHINAHGTGTEVNDTIEADAIQGMFGTDVPVVSTKGYTGHTLGAAGAIEFAFSALAIEEGWLPPSIHCDPLDPAIAIRIPTAVEQRPIRRVLSNSFAFGGNNCSVLVGAP